MKLGCVVPATRGCSSGQKGCGSSQNHIYIDSLHRENSAQTLDWMRFRTFEASSVIFERVSSLVRARLSW